VPTSHPSVTAAAVRARPKVLLHDHLDGGLRPATVVELADAAGHRLPTRDPDALAAWFDQRDRGADLPRYLDAFTHTVAVLQTRDALVRVAAECAEDLAADGVVHAEVRYAPELSTAGGLDLDTVIAAILDGLAAGPTSIGVDLLVCAMRQADRSEEVVAAALRARDRGVVGVDLAGPEAGFPAARHAAALALARDAGLPLTLHAGEAAGVTSIVDALDQGAVRLGHGVRLVDDLGADGDLGAVARRVRDAGVTLEVCPTSNVHTGVVERVADHPLPQLLAAGLDVTINTDNRLMSAVTATSELVTAAEVAGLDVAGLDRLTLAAVDATFQDDEGRRRLRAEVERRLAAVDGGGPARSAPEVGG
jgi:adenosine deaminase